MRFTSTRDSSLDCGFSEAVLAGLSDEGGLFYPKDIPQISDLLLAKWSVLSYADLFVEILAQFVDDELDISKQELSRLVTSVSPQFALSDWTRLHSLTDHLSVLELFHGPTFSFKDYAMCVLAALIDHLLAKRGSTAHVLVATSGDTGSAAINGFRSCARTQCSVLLPLGKVSEIQRRQMTTAEAKNVHAIQVRGDFDDCQRILKDALGSHLRTDHKLIAVNSVNIARIACQIVYYFWTAFELERQGRISWTSAAKENHGSPHRVCSLFDCVVPTGNFGNILAGYYAKLMGAPIGKLVIASNENDLLPRLLATGGYRPSLVIPTQSPSIDIQVSSNFERLLRHIVGRDVDLEYKTLSEQHHYEIEDSDMNTIRSVFTACRVDQPECLATIKSVYSNYNYLIDPHTAVAMAAALKHTSANYILVVATALPAKFPAAIGSVFTPDFVQDCTPESLKTLMEQAEYYDIIDPTLEALENLFKSRGW